MMKITTKTSKEELVKFLGESAEAVKKASKEVYDRLAYTSKAFKKDATQVTRKDLIDLAKEVMEVLTPSTPVVAEASLKPSLKKTEKTDKAETPKEPKVEEAEVVKDSKKTSDKKAKGSKKPASVVTTIGTEEIKFAESFELEGAKYELATDIKTMEDLHKVLENDEEIVFANYWTKKHLKQFPYFTGLVEAPKEFKEDLDLATVLYASDEGVITYALSVYTEALYSYKPEDFEDTDGVRYSSGMEFQIYRVVA